MAATLDPQDRITLRQTMLTRFNLAELKVLCFDLCLDYEQFPHATTTELCQSLITFYERTSNLACLIVEVLKRRQDATLAQLLTRASSCEPRKKVQIILANDVVIKPDIQAELARLLGVSVDEVALMASAPGSTRLLVGLPAAAADRLVQAGLLTLVDGKYQVVSVEVFESLPPTTQADWQQRVVEGPPPGPAGPSGPAGGAVGGTVGGAGAGLWGLLALVVGGLVVGSGLLWVITSRGAPSPSPVTVTAIAVALLPTATPLPMATPTTEVVTTSTLLPTASSTPPPTTTPTMTTTRTPTVPPTPTPMPSDTPTPTPLPAPRQLAPADGSVFGRFPRTTTLEWAPVPGAASYTIEWDWADRSDGTWYYELRNYLARIPNLTETRYTFDFIGSQPGRWRVVAVDADGQEGARSGWWTFIYTQ